MTKPGFNVRAKYYVLLHVWRVWHSRHPFPDTRGNRPAWHLCCNGDAGGWRTAFCDWLETGWRFSEYETYLNNLEYK